MANNTRHSKLLQLQKFAHKAKEERSENSMSQGGDHSQTLNLQRSDNAHDNSSSRNSDDLSELLESDGVVHTGDEEDEND